MSEISPAEDMWHLVEIFKGLGLRDFVLAALGTFLGAFSAFKLSSYSERRKLIQAEVRCVNSLIVWTFDHINLAENASRQLIEPKKWNWMNLPV